jgi:hypothetical protein
LTIPRWMGSSWMSSWGPGDELASADLVVTHMCPGLQENPTLPQDAPLPLPLLPPFPTNSPATAPNASRAAWRSSMISVASRAGSGRLSEYSGDSFRSQVISSFGLPL